MKNLKYILLTVFSLMIASSCSNFEELNTKTCTSQANSKSGMIPVAKAGYSGNQAGKVAII